MVVGVALARRLAVAEIGGCDGAPARAAPCTHHRRRVGRGGATRIAHNRRARARPPHPSGSLPSNASRLVRTPRTRSPPPLAGGAPSRGNRLGPAIVPALQIHTTS